MKFKFRKKKITGILNVVPENVTSFEDEVSNYSFPAKQTLRLKKIMGYKQHRVVKPTTSTSDMCIYGFKYLLENNLIKREEIGAIVVVTMTPDYFVPPTSNIIQGKCGLSEDVLCIDINQGCVGFLVGLMQSFMLLDAMNDKKVVLFNADVLSKKVSKHDRNSYPLIGDAATITIIENDASSKDISMNLYMDGSKGETLIIPAGGSRMPCTVETAIMKDSGDGNLRALDNLKMDGAEVFNFVQTKVPPMIQEAFEEAGCKIEDIDYFLFHQPNKFMLEKLADKAGIPREKVFMNVVENYGNPSGASIPVAITHNLHRQVLERKYSCCLSGFGSGLAWGIMFIELGELDFCETLVSDL